MKAGRVAAVLLVVCLFGGAVCETTQKRALLEEAEAVSDLAGIV